MSSGPGTWPAHTQDSVVVPVTPDQRAAIVRALAAGRSREWVADRMRIRFDTVMRVAISAGHPSKARLEAAAAALEDHHHIAEAS